MTLAFIFPNCSSGMIPKGFGLDSLHVIASVYQPVPKNNVEDVRDKFVTYYHFHLVEYASHF